MAIDPYESYLLTGEQIQDLARRLAGKQDGLTAGSNITISSNTISATDTTYSDFTGATSSVAGAHGLVPAPAAGDEGKALHGDGTWKDTTAKLVEMSYGEANSWAKFIAAYNAGSIVYCRASSNANPATGSQTRKAFMAYVNNATSPTNVEFQYVRSQSSKSDSQQCDQVFVYKLTNASGGTWTVETRDMATKINVDSTLNKTYSSGANASMTLGAKAMTGAASGTDGAAGIVPKPNSGDEGKFLRGDGTWAEAGAKEVTIIVTDKNPMQSQTYAEALNDLYHNDPMAVNVFQNYLNGQFGSGNGYCAFATGDASRYYKRGEVAQLIADGYTVRVIPDLNMYSNQNMEIRGMVISAANVSSNENVVFTLTHPNLMNSAGIASTYGQMSAGSDYWLYSGRVL